MRGIVLLRLALLGSLLGSTGVLTTGCGGGGGDHSSAATPAPVAPTTRLRSLKAGDQWVYDTTVEGAATGSGATTVTLSTVTLGDQFAFAQNITSTVVGPVSLNTSYVRQEANGTLYYAADFEGNPILPGLLALPGDWYPGIMKIIHRNYATDRFEITGTERITVPAGTFDTWRVRLTQGISAPNTDGTYITETHGDYWYAPELGTYVKAQYATTFLTGDRTGQTYLYRHQLKTTNVLNR